MSNLFNIKNDENKGGKLTLQIEEAKSFESKEKGILGMTSLHCFDYNLHCIYPIEVILDALER